MITQRRPAAALRLPKRSLLRPAILSSHRSQPRLHPARVCADLPAALDEGIHINVPRISRISPTSMTEKNRAISTLLARARALMPLPKAKRALKGKQIAWIDVGRMNVATEEAANLEAEAYMGMK